MGMPAPQPITTIEELLALPDDGLRHELLDGEHVVTPVPIPSHERVVMKLYLALLGAIGSRDDLEAFAGKAEIQLGSRTLVQPDAFIIACPEGQRVRAWADAPVPMLAIEVLSPSTASHDRGAKRRLYLEAGVEEYWIVDVNSRLVERWRSGDERPEIIDGTLEWSLGVGIHGAIDLPKLFASIE